LLKSCDLKQTVHIVIACSSLDTPAGYEKAITGSANLFCREGNQVTLLILDRSTQTAFKVDPEIRIRQLNLTFGISENGNWLTRKFRLLRDLWHYKKILKELRPDLLICTEYQLAAAAILSNSRMFTRVIAWEHHHFGAQQRNFFWETLFRYSYRRLDAVVCLNKDEQTYYQTLNKRTVVIPNFTAQPLETKKANQELQYDLLSVTRFTRTKGIDLLMETAKLVLKKQPSLRWKIIAQGALEADFLHFIREEKLEKQLLFQAVTGNNVMEEYSNARLFVMTSRNECFPLVLLEAMSQGLPCIAFDCETGPRHIIRHGINGWLVEKENPAKMAESIEHLLLSEGELEDMGRAAIELMKPYTESAVYAEWNRLFNRVLPLEKSGL